MNEFKIEDGIGTYLNYGIPTTKSVYGIVEEIINSEKVKVRYVNGYSNIVFSKFFQLMDKKETKIRLSDISKFD